MLSLSVGSVGLASLLLPRSWQEHVRRADRGGLANCWQRWRWGRSASGARARRRELESRPFLWLADRDRLPKLNSFAFGMAALGFGLWVWFATRTTNSLSFMLSTYSTFAVHLILKVRVAAEACWHLNAARRERLLETLLITPLTVEEVVRGQVMALRRRFLWPGIALSLMNLLFLSVVLRDTRLTSDVHMVRIVSWISLGGIVLLACDFYALSWVGMWLGLSGRHFSRVVGGTIGRVMGLRWLVFGLFVLPFLPVPVRTERVERFLASWVALGIVVDLVFALKAKRRLLEGLRKIAAGECLAPWVHLGWWPFSIDLDDPGVGRPFT
ncbi:MAG: hypothetical protein KGS61_10640 [Verrucomicrobia bacterium]|nr:hypothetical protein [Verrucomicrobiota bacterium]